MTWEAQLDVGRSDIQQEINVETVPYLASHSRLFGPALIQSGGRSVLELRSFVASQRVYMPAPRLMYNTNTMTIESVTGGD
jgi:hypothetical protein